MLGFPNSLGELAKSTLQSAARRKHTETKLPDDVFVVLRHKGRDVPQQERIGSQQPLAQTFHRSPRVRRPRRDALAICLIVGETHASRRHRPSGLDSLDALFASVSRKPIADGAEQLLRRERLAQERQRDAGEPLLLDVGFAVA